MSDLYVSWDEYHAKIEQLAAKIYQSQWEFDQILCLARGGLRIGDILSRIFDKPLAILSTSSYGGRDFQERGALKIAHSITMTTDTLGKRILLVDDLVDSGVTLAQILEWLKQHEEFDITEVRSAVLWFKACSVAKPDYYIDFLLDNPWIHQPFEQYEKIHPSDL
jgi:hypoxanthine phosphoribosyltransferase